MIKVIMKCSIVVVEPEKLDRCKSSDFIKIENLAKGINFAGTQFFRSRRLSENPNKVCKKVGYAKIKISKKGISKK